MSDNRGLREEMRRQTQLLEEIKRQGMTPQERAAADRAEAEVTAGVIRMLGIMLCAVPVILALFLGMIQWMKYSREQATIVSAVRVKDAITNGKSYSSGKTGSDGFSCGPRNGLGNLFYTDRPLSDDAIDVIAESDVSFYPFYGTTVPDSQWKRLTQKKNGWLIVNCDGQFFDGSIFSGSGVNIWLLKPRPDSLKTWYGHLGQIRVDAWLKPTPEEQAVDFRKGSGREIELRTWSAF